MATQAPSGTGPFAATLAFDVVRRYLCVGVFRSARRDVDDYQRADRALHRHFVDRGAIRGAVERCVDLRAAVLVGVQREQVEAGVGNVELLVVGDPRGGRPR